MKGRDYITLLIPWRFTKKSLAGIITGLPLAQRSVVRRGLPRCLKTQSLSSLAHTMDQARFILYTPRDRAIDCVRFVAQVQYGMFAAAMLSHWLGITRRYFYRLLESHVGVIIATEPLIHDA